MTKLKVSPCPLCGGGVLTCDYKQGSVWVGVITAMTQGVRCLKCKLQIDIDLSNRVQKDIPKKLKGMAIVRWLERQRLKTAVERWNKLYGKTKK
jgi:hypothetical protein